jgi:hypothetical protein
MSSLFEAGLLSFRVAVENRQRDKVAGADGKAMVLSSAADPCYLHGLDFFQTRYFLEEQFFYALLQGHL